MIVLVVAMVACGGQAKPAATTTSADMAGDGAKHGMDQKCGMGQQGEMGQKCEMGHMGEMGEMANMPPQIAKFHDTLAPRWHAKPGPQRMTDTCAAIGQFRADGDAIATSPAPSGGDAAAWSAGGKQLTDAVAALEKTCKANDAAAFEPAFERVHNTFHGLMGAASGKHGEHVHGEHEHGEHEHGEHGH